MTKRHLTIAIALGSGIVGSILLVRFVQRETPPLENVPERSEILYQGHPVSYWRGQMRSEGPFVRVKLLIGAGDPEAMPLLAKLLQDEDDSVRSHAAQSLSTIGAKAREVLPDIVVALRDSSPHVRMYATLALGSIPPQYDDTVKLLVAALKDAEICVRISAAEGLARIGPDARNSIPALRAALRDEDHYVAVQSALALYKIDRQIDHALPVLIDGLKVTNTTRHRGAALALKELGSDAEGAVRALIDALADEENVFYVVDALGAIGPKAVQAVPALLVILKSRQGQPRWWIDEALKKIDPVTADAVAVPEGH